jgi:hypothetical protein
MDVSWSEAQRAETNVIARSDDRATTNRKSTTARIEPRDDKPKSTKKRTYNFPKTYVCFSENVRTISPDRTYVFSQSYVRFFPIVIIA